MFTFRFLLMILFIVCSTGVIIQVLKKIQSQLHLYFPTGSELKSYVHAAPQSYLDFANSLGPILPWLNHDN